jgi:hypothetical protein
LERAFAQRIRRQLQRWAADTSVAAEDAPEPPQELNDRAADNWRPLLAIAADAGQDWLHRASRAALETAMAAEDDEDELTMLLHDLERLFSEKGEFVSTHELLQHLHSLEERPWGEYRLGKALSPHQLAALLKPIDVRPTKTRVSELTIRGYHRRSSKPHLDM